MNANLLMDKYTVDQQEMTKRMELGQDREQITQANELDAQKMEQEYENMEKELRLKMEELNETIRSNKADEAIQRTKGQSVT